MQNPFSEIDFLGLAKKHGKNNVEKGNRQGNIKKKKASKEDLNNEVAVQNRTKPLKTKNKYQIDSKSTSKKSRKPNDTESQIEEMYTKAPKAKEEIDAIADEIANTVGGEVAKALLKGKARALEKVKNDYEGDATRIKDIARNTIVVPNDQFDNTVNLLKQRGAKVKVIDGETDPMGYSGANSVIKTKSGLPAEIQVNTPEMIYAKEKPEIAKTIIGADKYNEIAKKTGIPGGKGHELYEKYRVLQDGDPEAEVLREQSKEYYNQIRKIGD